MLVAMVVKIVVVAGGTITLLQIEVVVLMHQ
jgi:hypothetical protein